MLRDHRRWILVALVSLLALLPLVPAAAAADDSQAWSVDPSGSGVPGGRSAFVYSLAPGQVFQDSVWITNVSSRPITFAVYARDAFNTDVDAGYALQLQREKPRDAATWIQIAVDRITVQPGTRADVPFQVTIPAGARPGDHAAGIIAEDVAPPTVHGNDVGVALQRRVAARIYVRVAGPLEPSLEVESIKVIHHSALLPPVTGRGDATVVYRIKNTGNVRMPASANVHVTGLLGRTIKRFPSRSIPELLPGSSVQLAERFEGLPAIDRLSASITVRGEGTIARGTHDTWVVSWLIVAILGGLLLALAGWRRRRRRRGAQGPGEPPVAARSPREPVGV
jgi:hypothetical protein